MNIELKPIAESKVRQLGGDVCGVLVRNEAGALAAVSECGRVIWTDDAEVREFEQAARQAPASGEVEPAIYKGACEHICVCGHRWWSGNPDEPCPSCNPQPAQQGSVPEVANEEMLDEGVTALIRGLKAFPGNYTQVVSNIWEDMLAAATPQPEGGEWFCTACGMKREPEQCNGQQDDTCCFEKHRTPPQE